MPQITPEKIIEFVRQRGDLQLTTLVQKCPFVARVAGDGLNYEIQNGKSRHSETKDVLERVCKAFNQNGGSLHPKHYYKKHTWNASYTVAVIHAYLNQ